MIEREDALDILACLVERSRAFDDELALSFRVKRLKRQRRTLITETESKATLTVRKWLIPQPRRCLKWEKMTVSPLSTYANVVVLTVEARDVLQSSPKHRRMPPMNLLQVDSYAPYLTDVIRVIWKISQDYERNIPDGEILEDEAMGHSMWKVIDDNVPSVNSFKIGT
jgi:hypothetical protein